MQACQRTYVRNRVGEHLSRTVANARNTIYTHYQNETKRRTIQLRHQETEYRLRLALEERDRLRNDLAHAKQLANDSEARCRQLTQIVEEVKEEREELSLELCGANDLLQHANDAENDE